MIKTGKEIVEQDWSTLEELASLFDTELRKVLEICWPIVHDYGFTPEAKVLARKNFVDMIDYLEKELKP